MCQGISTKCHLFISFINVEHGFGLIYGYLDGHQNGLCLALLPCKHNKSGLNHFHPNSNRYSFSSMSDRLMNKRSWVQIQLLVWCCLLVQDTLVLVQHKKHSNMTEKCWLGCQASTETISKTMLNINVVWFTFFKMMTTQVHFLIQLWPLCIALHQHLLALVWCGICLKQRF